MKMLIIEDTENKRSQILQFIRERFSHFSVSVAESQQSGLRLLISDSFDLVLLDMTLPTFDIGDEEDGGRPQAYAGREILRQMDRREITIPVIVVTQFDRFGEGSDALTLNQLDSQLRAAHKSTYRGSVYYDVSLEGWKARLASLILESVEDSGKSHDKNLNS